MAKNNRKYYLCVGKSVVDFSTVEELPDLNDFLSLALFTGMFKNRKELLHGLIQIDLLPSAIGDDEIYIAKRKRVTKKEFEYMPLNDDILYKEACDIMSLEGIALFFKDNYHHYEALSEFFKHYEKEMDELIENFKRKIRNLEAKAPFDANAKYELSKRKNSLNNFLIYVDNVKEILRIINFLSRDRSHFDRDLEIEYLARIKDFTDYETHYVRNGKRTPNHRGLVKLANKIKYLLDRYPNLTPPNKMGSFAEQRNAILHAYKRALQNVQARAKETYEENVETPRYSDPDSIMFLEREDYESLLDESSPSSQVESVEADIEALLKEQGNYGKL